MQNDQTTTDLKKIMDKARKLLALAERAGTPAEAATAAAKLSEMLLRHDLDMSKVKAVTEDEFVSEEYEMPEANLTMKGWAANLYGGIARANQCEAIIIGVSSKQKPKMGVVGRKHHVEIVGYMYEYLFNTLRTLSEEACNEEGIKGMERLRFKTAFCYGAAGVIGKRLMELKKKVQEDSSDMNALVVCEEKAVKEFYNQQFPGAKKVSRRIMSREGHSAGKIAGANVSLRHGVSGAGRQGQLA